MSTGLYTLITLTNMNPASRRQTRSPGRPSIRSPELAERLRVARSAAGLSQRELADRLNANNVTVCRYENGSLAPSPRRLRDIARALGCPVSALTGDEAPVETHSRNAPPAPAIESPMERLPDVFDWWIERTQELRGHGVLPQDILRVAATVQEIDAVRMRRSDAPFDWRTAPDVIREWEKLLAYLLDATKPSSRPAEAASG